MRNRQTSKISAEIIQTFKRTVLCALTVCVFAANLRAFDDFPAGGGTIITNRADASYEDASGNQYNAVSQAIMVTVARVPAISVTPDETAPSAATAANERVTREFRICNTGNSPDFFLPLDGTVSEPATINGVFFDHDDSGTVTSADAPVQFNQTLTPQLAPGSCYGVLFVIDTNALAAGSQFVVNLAARSTLTIPGTNDYARDIGVIINTVGAAAVFTAPTDANLAPLKLVENQPRTTAAPAQILNYTVAFRNSGAVAARQVRVIDDLPPELEYVPNTLRLNNKTLTDATDADEGFANSRRVKLLIPEIAPDAVTEIKFQARLNGTGSGSGIVNTANISAVNSPAVNTSPAVTVVSPIGTIYAGNSLGAVRVAGARVTLAIDENGTPLALTPGTGFEPNAANVNPFVSDGNGGFSFALNENQIGAANAPVRYVVNVTAANYRPRSLEVSISRIGGGSFYQASIRALDNQPIAVAGGFNLTGEATRIDNLAALVFNIPLFELSALEISKTADRQIVEIGDIITYRLQIKNSAAYTLRDARVVDTLPPFFSYVEGTAQIEKAAAQSSELTINRNELTFPLGDLNAGASVAIAYRVRVGANAPEGEHFNIAVASGTQPSGATVITPPAKASVLVRGGVFSLRQIIIGRVFEDRDANGKFDAGERAVAGARIYLNNGQSVITDSAGLYNIPAVGEGSLVVSLDPLTVPEGYFLTDDDQRRSSKSWTRLLRTPLGGGSLLRQNFAVAPTSDAVKISEDRKIIDVNVKTQTQNAQNSPEPSKTPVQIASLKQKIPLNIPSAANQKNSDEAERKTGTFTIEAGEAILPIAAGSILIVSPQAEEVIMAPALAIKTRVAKGWTVEAVVNGEKVSASNVGETRVDNRNNVTTYSFVGINLREGENLLRVTTVGADGTRGKTAEIKVWGRGAVEKLEIVPAKNQLQAGGREAVAVEIRAFDRRGTDKSASKLPPADSSSNREAKSRRKRRKCPDKHRFRSKTAKRPFIWSATARRNWRV